MALSDPRANDSAVHPRSGALRIAPLPPLSLYVHFPWCLRKCPYCDFNSYAVAPRGAGFAQTEYLEALRADLEHALPLVWGRPIVSVFIGGGTPSLLSADAVERLLSDVRALLPLQADCEITLEANPGTFEAEKFRRFRAAGVNRLSLGVQSFDDDKLVALGRAHDSAQARAAVDSARAEFDNFNIDLMYALPRQTSDQWGADVERALAAGAPHLSLYQLTIEPRTAFAKQPPELPDEDAAARMHEWTEARGAAAGYAHYEVSAYARPGFQCRHNLNYWSFGDYLGIGAGAASKLSFPHRVIRQTRWQEPAAYLRGTARRAFIEETVEVDHADLPFEFMLNALRLNEGFPRAWFAQRTGLAPSAMEAGLRKAEEKGLLHADAHRIRPTALGRRFLSDLQTLFLPAKKARAK